jgi:hypothetical protein
MQPPSEQSSHCREQPLDLSVLGVAVVGLAVPWDHEAVVHGEG